MHRWCLIACTLILSVGCYFHSVVSDASPKPGSTVLVKLSQDSDPRLTALIGPNAYFVDGHVLKSTSDSLALALSHVQRLGGHVEPWHGEHVAFPRSIVAGVERRRLSVPATAALVGGIMTGLVALGKVVAKQPVMR
jgi:hypothetical protein